MHRSADQIKEDVVRHLLWDERVGDTDINVEVSESGTVILSGSVDSAIVRQAAGEDVLQIAGVSRLENQIELKSSCSQSTSHGKVLARRLKMLFALNPSVDEHTLSMAVEGNEVYLGGTVESLWKKLRAEELVFTIMGVERVCNKITVVPSKRPLDRQIAKDIADTLERLGIDRSTLNIQVNGAKVVLSGEVRGWQSYSAAYSSAQFTRGVIDVDNNLAVRG